MEEFKKIPLLQIIFLSLLSILLFSTYMTESLNPINSTSFAFTYEYGFISRGFMGTLFAGFCFIFKALYSPQGLVLFTQILAAILFILVISLIAYCYSKIDNNKTIYLTYVSYFLIVGLISTYVSNWNLGRLDTYCLMFSIIACFAIVAGKNIWICIPCAIIATLIHQGYVFMYANIILVLLLFCAIRNRDGKRKTYMTVLAFTFLSISVLFLYMEFFSHTGKDIYYDTVVNNAGYLNMYGLYHYGVIDKELLGISLYEDEKEFLSIALKTLFVYIIMVIPYIYVVVRFFVKLCKSAKNKTDLLSYGVLIIGSLTLVPEFILKCDYGRWILCLIAYYIITFLVASTIDNRLIDTISDYLIPKKRFLIFISMAYIWLFAPFRDILVSYIPAYIANIIFHFV